MQLLKVVLYASIRQAIWFASLIRKLTDQYLVPPFNATLHRVRVFQFPFIS